MLLLLLLAVTMAQEEDPLAKLRNEIFQHDLHNNHNLGHNYERCSQYMGYRYEADGEWERSKCVITILKCKDEKLLSNFLQFLQVFNNEL